MSDAPLILGVSGLRGIVGESLTPEVAVRYAGAVGTWFAHQDPYVDSTDIVVGHDGRAGHEVVYHAVIAGLLANGWSVIPIGCATTPTVGYAASSFGSDADHQPAGAIVITASHNPQEWNGIKVLTRLIASEGGIPGVSAPSSAGANEIIRRFEQHDLSWPPYPLGGQLKRGASITNLPLDFADLHAQKVASLTAAYHRRTDYLRAVVDSVNASGARATECLLRQMDVKHIQLHGDGSGIFPHTPEPTKENLSGEGGLCDAVPGLKADVGFAQDPDADRLAIVDEKGNYIGEEYTLVLCAMSLLTKRKDQDDNEAKLRERSRRASYEGWVEDAPKFVDFRGGPPASIEQWNEERGVESTGLKPVIVVNLSTSRMIDDVAARYGAEVVRTPVGEANVVEAMKRLSAEARDVVMGGEGNGGVIWPEVTYVRDSLSAMALTLALMARTGKTVSELVSMINAMGPGMRGYCIIKRKAPLASKADAVPVVEHVAGHYRGADGAAVDTQDGVRIDWPERGVWAHVRASNTEPIMRVIVEAPTEGEADRVAAEVEGVIAAVKK